MWAEVYWEAFPDIERMEFVHDVRLQKLGCDRILILRGGRRITVDEKSRRTAYPDFCLEYWSDLKRRKPGWMAKTQHCDYIAYAFIPISTCYMLPFGSLRRAWKLNRREWVKSFRRIDSRNQGYVTRSVAVPIGVVMTAVSEAMVIKWNSATRVR